MITRTHFNSLFVDETGTNETSLSVLVRKRSQSYGDDQSWQDKPLVTGAVERGF